MVGQEDWMDPFKIFKIDENPLHCHTYKNYVLPALDLFYLHLKLKLW